MLHKEWEDWVRYLHVVASAELGVTRAQRVEELGGSKRTFRRLRARLQPHFDDQPRRATPRGLINALIRRVAPSLERR